MNAPNAQLPARQAPQKAQVMAGGPVAALVPQSLDEAFRVASAIASSGLAPRGLDKPEQIMVAIMAGAELGLAPFQALQSFAVVNGRPTLWGDGLVAVARAQGVKVEERLEGDGEGMAAWCRVTRPDTGEQIERTFSVADAKKASLWGKQGPWQSYPKRMLAMRARAWALRDGCADMLRGFQVREEVEDYQPIRDVAPQPSGLRERLTARTGALGDGFDHANVNREVDAALNPERHDPQTGEIIEADFTDPPADDGMPVRDDSATADDASDFPGDAKPCLEGLGLKTGAEVASEQGVDDTEILDWAASFNRGIVRMEAVADVSDAWNAAKANGQLAALKKANPSMAKALADAVNERVAEITGTAG